MRLLSFTSGLIGILLLQQQCVGEGYNYWRHPSCIADHPENRNSEKQRARADMFVKSLKEARNMAAKAYDYLEAAATDKSDTHFNRYHKRIFQYLFKADLTDKETREEVTDALATIFYYKSTDNHQQSRIRFYCDAEENNPARYVLVPDADPSIKGKRLQPNSQRTDKQEWDDVENGIRLVGNVRDCFTDQADAYTAGMMGPKGVDMTLETEKYKHHAWPRVAINFCPNFFHDKGLNTVPELMERELGPNAKHKWRFRLAQFKWVRSLTTFHEILHAPGFSAIDHCYAWDGLNRLSKEQAIENTDSIVYYALLLTLAETGWGLEKDLAQANLGHLNEYPEIKPPPKTPKPTPTPTPTPSPSPAVVPV